MKTEQTASGLRVAVLGGGISGLSAAFYLRKTLPEVDVRLWEASDRVGGALCTFEQSGFQVEQGVDNFITTETAGLDLCREVGLENDIVPTNNRFRRTFVVRKGSLYPLPDGFLMMAPTKLFPLALTRLLSPQGKIRAGLELLLPRGGHQDETLRQFVVRRLGTEVYDRIVEPLVSGIYAGDAARLSVWATLPWFPEMERKHRSLIWAMKRQQKSARQIKRAEESGARYSFFVTLRRGLGSLVEAIVERLPAGTLHVGRSVRKVTRNVAPDGRNRWVVTDETGVSEEFDAVICTLPTHVYSKVFTGELSTLGQLGAQIEHSSAVVATVGFKTGQLGKPMNGMGFVVPEKENAALIAGSFSSHKYPHRAPEGTTLLRLFAGGTRRPELVNMAENELTQLLLKELGGLLGIQGEPLMVDLARWPASMPQYNVGHLALLDQFEREISCWPGLFLAGNSFRGVGIPACVKSSLDAVEKVQALVNPGQ